MKVLKRILKYLLILVIFLVICFAGLIAYALISDYKPEKEIKIASYDKPDILSDSAGLTILTWNVGYCGLDKDMDFFYDGGKKVFTPKEKLLENLGRVKKLLKQNDSIDFFLIQEIDKKSKRSYRINEYDTLKTLLNGYQSLFADNYDVFFVPVPPLTPMGKVYSGLATFCRFLPSSSVRFAFPGEYGFPKQLFMLDRCFLVTRYPLSGGKELLLLNTHNEAFDPGDIRKAQMAYLREFLLSEYEKGNYIITGGDWNQAPPGFSPEFAFNKVNTDQMQIDADYLPSEWKWAYDKRTPSNRTVITGYDPASTPTTVIDFFLLSPNIDMLDVECYDLNFESSDHNPVRIKVKLKN